MEMFIDILLDAAIDCVKDASIPVSCISADRGSRSIIPVILQKNSW